jgi:hypothetical protein
LRPLNFRNQVVGVAHDLVCLALSAGNELRSRALSLCTLLHAPHPCTEIGNLCGKSIEIVCDTTTEIIAALGRNQQPDTYTNDGTHECPDKSTRNTSTLN